MKKCGSCSEEKKKNYVHFTAHSQSIVLPVTVFSDEDDDDIDEHGMSALERKQLKQAMTESRYTEYVEEETPMTFSRGFFGGSSKGQLLDQNVEFHKVLEQNQVLRCLPLALTHACLCQVRKL
ncbi:hypothetical protein Salat_2098000 [Sesamum alatum]|uniref:Uncharacterized protein n=1 Tax=Sesamum alatum TaxID=300844 RepID=A0AAE2CGQ7_9LAMI|nr:hypothetical protein Salat_2098000 [Sesamum alatum]